ncbi:MAG TPA: VWA domain-containing protein, partial [Vicinamibacteria bacterium]|nr:VWA domain-containing protein [Vicinamibacteria bacterium]
MEPIVPESSREVGMRVGRRRVSLSILLMGTAVAAAAEEASSLPTAAFASGTERVQVDLVVRDKKGGLLRGLGPADFEIKEDGVVQEVVSLEFVEAPLDLGAPPAGSEEPPGPPTFVAVVFDRLGSGARAFAQQAILDYVDSPGARRAWFAAFGIDRGLTTLVSFTGDRDALRRALGPLTSRAPTAFSGLREREKIRTAYAGLAEGFGQAHVASAELAGTPECRAVEDEVHRRLELMDSRLMEAYESLERDEQGLATAHALLALVEGLSRLPGRKAVVLFSEGLFLPAREEASLRAVVAAATRGHVGVYAVDAGGLRAASAAEETRRSLDVLKTRLQPEDEPRLATRGPSSSTGPQSRLALLEKNEDLLRSGAESGLGRLAEETGGFLVRDTNDLTPGLARIDEELGSYYLLSYSPKDQRYDGRFRTITVKLRRPHGRIQARKGYFALRTPVAALDHEAAALARLEAPGPLPSEVPLRLSGLQFPIVPDLPVVPIVVEAPASGLRFVRDEKADSFRQDFTIVALVRDGAGDVVAKMSQRYALTGPISKLDAARRADIRFYRETRLPPGAYVLEAVVYDTLADAAGAVRASLEIPAAASGRLRASSVVVVGRAEKLAETNGVAGPLQYHDVLLHPNLGAPVRREPGQG